MAETKRPADTADEEAAVAQRDTQRLRTESAANVGRESATDLGTHPTIERAQAGAAGSGRTLVVMHGAVGPYTAGMRVPENGFGENADMQRLIDLGAVGYEDELDQGEVSVVQTLDEAARSDSPPTLPVAPDVDANPIDLMKVAAGDLDALERAAQAETTQARAEELASARSEAALAAVPQRQRAAERTGERKSESKSEK